MERSRVVPTAAGELTVGVMSWAGYRKVKCLLLEFVGKELSSALQAAFTEAPRDEAGNVITRVEVLLPLIVPRLASAVASALDNATLDVLRECGVSAEAVAQLGPSDIVALRDAAAAVNDFERLLEAEKNLLGGLVGKALQSIGIPVPWQRLSGGPAGNPA